MAHEIHKVPFGELFEVLTIGIAISQEDGRFIDVNKAFCEKLGYTKSELLAKDFISITHPDDRKKSNEKFEELLQGKIDNYHLEKRYIKKDLSILWVILSVSSISITEVSTKYTICTVEDITARKQAEQAIIESERKFSTLFHNAPLLIAVSPLSNGKYIDVNEAFAESTGYSKAEIVGNTSEDLKLISAEDRKVLIEKLRSDKKISSIEANIRRKDGHLIHCLYSAELIEVDGEMCLLSVAQDMTTQKKNLEALTESKEQFSAIFKLSHIPTSISEIRTSVYTDVNDAWCSFLGFSKEEAIGKTLVDIGIISHETHMLLRREFMAKGHIRNMEVDVTTRHGLVKTILSSVEQFTIGNDNYAINLMVDITAQKETERALIEEKNRFISLASTAPGALASYQIFPDGSQTMPYSSPQITEIYGFSPEQLAIDSTSVIERVHPDDNNRVKETIDESARSLKIWRCEFRYNHPTKGQIWLEGHSAPTKEEDGSIIWHGFITEITKRKTIEIALKESENKYRALIEGMNETVWVTNFEGNIIELNNKVCETLGYTREEVQNASIFDIDKSLKKEDIIEMGKALISKKLLIRETSHFAKDGSCIPVEIYCSLITFDGKPALLIISRDITERKHAELALLEKNSENMKLAQDYQALNEELADHLERMQEMNIKLEAAKQKAEESDRLKTTFLANMSHEVRTPLNALLGFTGLMASKTLEEEKRLRYVDYINSSGRRLTQLINDIIDFSKIESHQLSITPLECTISEIVEKAILIFQNDKLVLNRKLDLFYNIPANCKGLSVETDELRVQQILDNLISNAIKFTEKGSIEVGMKLIQENQTTELEIYVKDTGTGIPKKKHDLIFERFRQGEDGSTRGGTGLGLSISRGLVKLLGGRIWFTSEWKKGTTFYFTLPVK